MPRKGQFNRPSDIWKRVRKYEDDGCWEWTGHRKKGYGSVMCEGTIYQTHRLAWELTHGPIPKGLCVLHKCDNPPCCRPDHLFLGTHADNVDDRVRKGRGADVTGENGPGAKLTVKQVQTIHELLQKGVLHRIIAKRFKIHRGYVSLIKIGRTWKHLHPQASNLDRESPPNG